MDRTLGIESAIFEPQMAPVDFAGSHTKFIDRKA